jgi:hypothetical protein
MKNSVNPLRKKEISLQVIFVIIEVNHPVRRGHD